MPERSDEAMTDRRQPELLFIYGSLRRGEPMFAQLGLEAALDFVSDGTIRAELYDLGDYPGAVSAPGIVRGEVYRIKDPAVLEILDRYEEYDPRDPAASLFRRVRIAVEGVGSAWTYLYNGSRDGCRRIRSGEWRRRPAA